jgi:hypothetical protein
MGSISFRTRVSGLEVLAYLTPHPPRRGPENILQWESGEIRKFTIGSQARYRGFVRKGGRVLGYNIITVPNLR